MAELSESELLLLDNFMYISDSAQTNTTVGEIADRLLAKGVSESKLSGGISVAQAVDILEEIRDNPNLCDLTIEASVNNEGVRASCFVDSDNNATVAFRGTGGSYEAWKDNLLGAYEVDTQYQQEAADFIKESCSAYDNITVTGHSKGGNMAQYCTVLCGDQIDRCVSYDGQGFNADFLEEYADEIAENQGKISSICCNNDYVNILLTSIAGETKYLETEAKANAHSSWELYLKNKNGVDEDGNFIHTVAQSDAMKILDWAADSLVDNLGRLPNRQEQAIVNALASDVGVIFAISSGQFGWDQFWDFCGTHFLSSLTSVYYASGVGRAETFLTYMYHSLVDAWDMLTGADATWGTQFAAGIQAATGMLPIVGNHLAGRAAFAVSFRGLQGACQELVQLERELEQIDSRLDAVRLSGKLAGNAELNGAMKKIRENVKEQYQEMRQYQEILEACIRCYQETEQRCVSGYQLVAN